MRSWRAPDVPSLPGHGETLQLFDASTGALRPALIDGVAHMYVCGITPYDATHLGHAATYIAFDLVNRVWRDSGQSVHYVQNITDIDDPLLERAQRDHEDWTALSRREIELFATDMAALQVVPPTAYVAASEVVPEIVEDIQRLFQRGAAYYLDSDIYFSIESDRGRVGYQSTLDIAELLQIFAESGGDPYRPGKKNPLDPLLWRGIPEGEPSWPSPFGSGRPGWHIECTTIAVQQLGMGFDLQGGGRDLVFPHHEMTAAQAEVMTEQRPFAKHFAHVGMVGWQGEKMSKSRGNLVLVSQLREAGVDPMAIRLALLASHYRADREWTDHVLTDANRRLARWRHAMSLNRGPDALWVLDDVRRCLADDLDTVGALSTVDRWVEDAIVSGGPDTSAPLLVSQTVKALLGIE